MKLKYLTLIAASLLLASASASAAKPQGTWEKCASHGGMCGKGGKSRMVRYGYADNWAEAEIKGEVPCMPEEFDGGEITGTPFAALNSGGVAEADKYCEEK